MSVGADSARSSSGDAEPDGIEPAEIDAGFVARPRASVVSAPVGQEMVLVDSDSGFVHALNPLAALVWQCFDDESSLDDIVADLAEGFNAPPDRVLDDVVSLARTAGQLRLLDGVSPVESVVPTTIGGLPVGAVVTFDPAPRDRRRVLLVHWSAVCGYCIRIVPELAALQPALDRAGIDIVLLDEHGPDATRTMLEEQGLVARVTSGGVAGPDGLNPFAAMGTPVAYLLDADGAVESPLAYGAEYVVELARTAAGAGSPEGDVPLFLPVAGGVCAPSVAPTAAVAEWKKTGSYSVGPYRVGIRANTVEGDRIVASVLAAHRLDSEHQAPENFTVTLADEGGPRRRDLSLLMAGSEVLARSRSPRRVVGALIGHLSCLLDPQPGLERLDAAAAVIDGEGVLLPKVVLSWLERVQAPLARMGVALVDAPFAHIDLATSELVVPAPAIQVDQKALESLPDPRPGASEPGAVPTGRYPLRRWLLASHDGSVGVPSASRAVASALGTLVCEPSDLVGALDEFVNLLAKVDVRVVSTDSPAALLDELRVYSGPKQ